MKEKINIAELLKDCPKGMELDCTMYDGLVFVEVDLEAKDYPITTQLKNGTQRWFTSDGRYELTNDAKCVIFPKGKTTWEGFIPPYEFKDGDVLSYQYKGYKNRTIYIYMQHSRMNTTYYVALSGDSDSRFMVNDKEGHALNSYDDSVRLATEEEKKKLFDAIKDNGYKWNPENNTLEKLPKFKIGDKIRHKSIKLDCILREYSEDILAYRTNIGLSLTHKDLGDWELVPNKFDITTLVPFESRVLVRSNMDGLWKPAVFGFRNGYNDNAFYIVGGSCWKQCIPYLNNEHLRGTTNDCDEYYKNW